MTLLLQISDTHFGTEQPPVVEALVRLAHEQAPDLVVLSGDITQRARRKQFRAARAFVDRLGVAVTLAIPGNHDIPLFDVAARLFYPVCELQQRVWDRAGTGIRIGSVTRYRPEHNAFLSPHGWRSVHRAD